MENIHHLHCVVRDSGCHCVLRLSGDEKENCKSYCHFALLTFPPETNSEQLEELDDIFEAKNPVKFSIATHKLALTEDGTVVAVDDEVKI